MNFFKNKLAVILILAAFTSAKFAQAGGINGGGGSIAKSTPEEVKEAFNEAASRGLEYFMETSSKAVKSIQDPDLKQILLKINRNSIVSYKLKESLRYSNSPCESKDGKREASVSQAELYSPICLSLPLLTKLPKASLKEVAITLLAHEIAHQLGADEELAVKVENFYSGWLLKSQPLVAASQINTILIDEVKYLLLAINEGETNQTRICAGLGSIAGLNLSYDLLTGALKIAEEHGVADYGLGATRYPNKLETREVNHRELKLLTFCSKVHGIGFDPHPAVEAVPLGKIGALQRALSEYLTLLLKQKEQLTVQTQAGGLGSPISYETKPRKLNQSGEEGQDKAIAESPGLSAD